MTQIADLIQAHPAATGPFIRRDHGYTLPASDDLELIEISEDTVPLLARNGITIIGEYGVGNKVTVHPGNNKAKLKINLIKADNNIVVVSPEARCAGIIEFVGSGHLFVCGHTGVINIAATFRTDRCALFIGARCTGASVNFWVEGPDLAIQIGDDCMFSWNIYVRTSDGHGVVDLRERKKVNHHAAVIIGPHVWVGQDAVISKGVNVGGGSIISAKSVVTKSVADCVSVAGIPAKIVRDAVSWTRRAYPTDIEMTELFEWPFVIGASGAEH